MLRIRELRLENNLAQAVVFHCYVDVVLRDAKRFYVPDADKQRKKFDKIISHETHLL